jgi:hypothetical protein
VKHHQLRKIFKGANYYKYELKIATLQNPKVPSPENKQHLGSMYNVGQVQCKKIFSYDTLYYYYLQERLKDATERIT